MSKMSATLSEFSNTTTIQGVAEIYNAQSKCSRTNWVIVFVALFAITGFSVYQVIDTYINAPIVSSVSTLNAVNLTLPQIVVCYTGAINVTKLVRAGLSENVTKAVYWLFQQGGLDSTSVLRWRAQSILTTEFQKHRPILDKFMSKMNFSNFDDLVKYAAFGCMEIFDSHGIQAISNMTLLCESIETMIHALYGVCYKLPQHVQIWPAAVAGWQILLKAPKESSLVNDAAYSKGFALEFGMTYTTITYDTTLVPVNKSVAVGLSATLVKKLSNRQWPRNSELDYCNETLNNYSANYCHLWCYTTAVLDTCGCGPIGMKNMVNASAPACLPDSLNCTYRLDFSWEGWLLQCQYRCIPPCEEWKFDVKLTYNEFSASKLLNQLNLTATTEGLTLLTISYPQLRYTIIEEQDAFTFDATISNVGGMMGLYLGGSIFTVVHTIAFALTYMWQQLGRVCKKKPNVENIHLTNRYGKDNYIYPPKQCQDESIKPTAVH